MAGGAISEYRNRVRPKIPSGYDGWNHVWSLLLATGLATLLPLVFISFESVPAFASLPAWLAYGNIGEYIAHRWGGHMQRKPSILPLRLFNKYLPTCTFKADD